MNVEVLIAIPGWVTAVIALTGLLYWRSRAIHVPATQLHSQKLKEVMEAWRKDIGEMTKWQRLSEVKVYGKKEEAAEEAPLFKDLWSHVPKEIQLLKSWGAFKDASLNLRSLYSHFSESLIEDVTAETGLPLRQQIGDESCILPTFGTLIIHKVLVTNERIHFGYVDEERGGKLLVKEEYIPVAVVDSEEQARRIHDLFLKLCDESSEVGNQILSGVRIVEQTKTQLMNRIDEAMAIPLLPGDCIYLRHSRGRWFGLGMLR